MKLGKKLLIALGLTALYPMASYAGWKNTFVNKTDSTIQLKVVHDAWSTSTIDLQPGASKTIENPGISCVVRIELKAVSGQLNGYTGRYPGQMGAGGIRCGNNTYTFSPAVNNKGEKFIRYSYK
ncbi:MAG TPA: hypothetical protein PLU71_04455 [Candidatus Dependentiae bacterium]|nr:hypothetical protein [Candidatus Dependentiae bacterium]HRQ63084.1 hypothetical protein [Candidatus Dependentiae bacterium]